MTTVVLITDSDGEVLSRTEYDADSVQLDGHQIDGVQVIKITLTDEES